MVKGPLAIPISLGWFATTEAEANQVAAAVGVGLLGDNGEMYFPKIGDLIRVDGSDELNIIRSNGTIKKL